MVNKSGALGTKAETAVVRALWDHGFPHAERRRLRGRLDAGDLTGTPGIAWEVKGGAQAKDAARSGADAVVGAWLAEAEVERVNAGADVGVLVLQRPGVNYPDAAAWWAVLRMDTLAWLIGQGLGADLAGRTAGYPLDHPVRMSLGAACHLLRLAGYGTPVDDVAEAAAAFSAAAPPAPRTTPRTAPAALPAQSAQQAPSGPAGRR